MIGEKDYWRILLGYIYIYIVLDNTPYIAIVFHNFSESRIIFNL